MQAYPSVRNVIFMYEMVVRLVSGKANPLSRRWSDDGRRTHARSAPSTTFRGTLDYYSSIKYISYRMKCRINTRVRVMYLRLMIYLYLHHLLTRCLNL